MFADAVALHSMQQSLQRCCEQQGALRRCVVTLPYASHRRRCTCLVVTTKRKDPLGCSSSVGSSQEQLQPEPSNFVPWHSRLFAGLPSRRLGYDPKSVCVISVVNRVEMGEFCLRVLRFSPFSIMQWNCYLHFGTAVTSRRNEPCLGTFQRAVLFLQSKALDSKLLTVFFPVYFTNYTSSASQPCKHHTVPPVTDDPLNHVASS